MTNSAEKPVILIPALENYDETTWEGGRAYIKNFLATFDSLEEAERPRVIIVCTLDVLPNFISALAAYHCVEGIFSANNPPAKLSPYFYDKLVRDEQPVPDGMAHILAEVLCSYPLQTLQPGLPNPIYWIPDFQHKHLPHLFPEQDIAYRENNYAALAAQQAPLVLSSHDARQDFEQFYPDHQATPVTWQFVSSLAGNTPSTSINLSEQFGIPEKFLFLPNQFWKHKDHETVFRALHILKSRGLDIPVVMTGPTDDYRHPGYYQEMMSLARDQGIDHLLHHLGFVDRDVLGQIFRSAAAILQPSLFEGWSTVIEDTKSLGRPLILSDLNVHHEQVGEDGLYFERQNFLMLADILEQTWPALSAGPEPEKEQQATAHRITRQKTAARQFLAAAKSFYAKEETATAMPSINWNIPTEFNPATCMQVPAGQTQWYDPCMISAATIVSAHRQGNYVQTSLDFLQNLTQDDYARFMVEYLQTGLNMAGQNWQYADIVTTLMCLADILKPRDYLEIGVRQGRSASAVASRAPECNFLLCDMWMDNYAGMENPGPDFVARQLARQGHQGHTAFLNGDSHIVLPEWLQQNPDRRFDLITVDGDHSPEGAADDLRNVLPRLRIGGAVVFDDTAHPAHQDLAAVWHAMTNDPERFSCHNFSDLGYGIGFALRIK